MTFCNYRIKTVTVFATPVRFSLMVLYSQLRFMRQRIIIPPTLRPPQNFFGEQIRLEGTADDF